MFAEAIYLLILVAILALCSTGWLGTVFSIFAVIMMIPVIPILASLKTAPFVPSRKDRIQTMLKLAKIKPGEKVYDLGAGDGRIVSMAADLGANAIGFEISFPLFLHFRMKKFFGKTTGGVYWRNIWSQDYKDADTIIVFLMPQSMDKFYKKIYPTLKSGTKIISNAFEMPHVTPVKVENGIYLYIK